MTPSSEIAIDPGKGQRRAREATRQLTREQAEMRDARLCPTLGCLARLCRRLEQSDKLYNNVLRV